MKKHKVHKIIFNENISDLNNFFDEIEKRIKSENIDLLIVESDKDLKILEILISVFLACKYNLGIIFNNICISENIKLMDKNIIKKILNQIDYISVNNLESKKRLEKFYDNDLNVDKDYSNEYNSLKFSKKENYVNIIKYILIDDFDKIEKIELLEKDYKNVKENYYCIVNSKKYKIYNLLQQIKQKIKFKMRK